MYAVDETSIQESSASDEFEDEILINENVTEDADMETDLEDVQETVPSEESTENIQGEESDGVEEESFCS